MRLLEKLASFYIALPNHRYKHGVLRRFLKLIQDGKVRSKLGPYFRVDHRDITNLLSLTGGSSSYSYGGVAREVETLTPGMAFIDIGANAGIFSMMAGSRVAPGGVVIAFEPSFPVFSHLVENARLNGLSNFHPFNVAIGGRTELARFSTPDKTHTGIAHLSATGGRTVLQVSFDDIAPMIWPLIGNRPIMIKIDVEGAEVVVVRSIMALLRGDAVITVVIEVNSGYLERFNSSIDELYELMRDCGFSFRLGLQKNVHYDEIFVK